MIMEFGKKKIFGKVYCRKYSIKNSKKLYKRKKINHYQSKIIQENKKMEMTIKSLLVVLWAISIILVSHSKPVLFLVVTNLIDLIGLLARMKRTKKLRQCAYLRCLLKT